MQTTPLLRVTAVDRSDDGVIVSFDDGRNFLYPASLLQNIISQTQELLDGEEND